MAVRGCPIDWKYVVARTFTEIVHNMQFATIRSCVAVARSSVFAESTNIDAMILGNGGIVCIALATMHSAVVIQNPRMNVSRTREKFRAPQL
jgi:hypothetical protein